MLAQLVLPILGAAAAVAVRHGDAQSRRHAALAGWEDLPASSHVYPPRDYFWGPHATFWLKTESSVKCTCPGEIYSDENARIAAIRYPGLLNDQDGHDTRAEYCNRWVEVSYQGKTVRAQVKDGCASCRTDEHIDLSPGAIRVLDPQYEKTGVLEGATWKFVDGGGGGGGGGGDSGSSDAGASSEPSASPKPSKTKSAPAETAEASSTAATSTLAANELNASDPAATETSSAEASAEPWSAEPSSTEWSAESSSTEPASAEPSSTEPSSTEPSSTESSSTESSAEPPSTAPSATESANAATASDDPSPTSKGHRKGKGKHGKHGKTCRPRPTSR